MGGSKPNFPARDRDLHYQHLKQSFEQALVEGQQKAADTKKGYTLQFANQPGFDFATNSLEDTKAGIKLLNVRSIPDAETIATVFIPEGRQNKFLKKLEDYHNPAKDVHSKNSTTSSPKNKALIEGIEQISAATVNSFWTDRIELIPNQVPLWCELWLSIDGDEDKSPIKLFELLLHLGIRFSDRSMIKFPQRAVLPICANLVQLTDLVNGSNIIAELRAIHPTADFWIHDSPTEQAEWATELAERLVIDPLPRSAVCILDTGVNNGHILLNQVLPPDNCLTVNPEWGTADHDGHGTNMAGIALYGKIEEALESTDPIEIKHILESVKILPPDGGNEKEAYGYITQQAVSQAEIQNPGMNNTRVLSMAITASDSNGKPSSWSAAIDQYASGYLDDRKRLFLVSAGNIQAIKYPDDNLASTIQDPAQAWNTLTVGAFTEKEIISPTKPYTPVAQTGELSPFSSTSVEWKGSKWPIKPDILMEGGNLAKDVLSSFDYESLSSITTHFQPLQRQFDVVTGTSPATAEAAWFAAQIWAEYPNVWPETIRGMMIHSARWTAAMKKQFLNGTLKTDYEQILRICGFGVPEYKRAISSFNNSLTLVSEGELSPFKQGNSSITTHEMRLYQLPWPQQALLDLGELPVTLRVTLSYFIEPSPGERGWKNRYQYASHGLRFDLSRPTENKNKFQKRINKAIQEEEADGPRLPNAESLPWTLGTTNHRLGSVHSDWLTTTAASLASMDHLAIYPVGGWWKTRPKEAGWKKKARYSLIISIETPAIEVDLYSLVKNQIKVPVVV